MKSGKIHRFLAVSLTSCSLFAFFYVNTSLANEEEFFNPLPPATVIQTTVPEKTAYITPATIKPRKSQKPRAAATTTSTILNTTTSTETTVKNRERDKDDNDDNERDD